MPESCEICGVMIQIRDLFEKGNHFNCESGHYFHLNCAKSNRSTHHPIIDCQNCVQAFSKNCKTERCLKCLGVIDGKSKCACCSIYCLECKAEYISRYNKFLCESCDKYKAEFIKVCRICDNELNLKVKKMYIDIKSCDKNHYFHLECFEIPEINFIKFLDCVFCLKILSEYTNLRKCYKCQGQLTKASKCKKYFFLCSNCKIDYIEKSDIDHHEDTKCPYCYLEFNNLVKKCKICNEKGMIKTQDSENIHFKCDSGHYFHIACIKNTQKFFENNRSCKSCIKGFQKDEVIQNCLSCGGYIDRLSKCSEYHSLCWTCKKKYCESNDVSHLAYCKQCGLYKKVISKKCNLCNENIVTGSELNENNFVKCYFDHFSHLECIKISLKESKNSPCKYCLTAIRIDSNACLKCENVIANDAKCEKYSFLCWECKIEFIGIHDRYHSHSCSKCKQYMDSISTSCFGCSNKYLSTSIFKLPICPSHDYCKKCLITKPSMSYAYSYSTNYYDRKKSCETCEKYFKNFNVSSQAQCSICGKFPEKSFECRTHNFCSKCKEFLDGKDPSIYYNMKDCEFCKEFFFLEKKNKKINNEEIKNEEAKSELKTEKFMKGNEEKSSRPSQNTFSSMNAPVKSSVENTIYNKVNDPSIQYSVPESQNYPESIPNHLINPINSISIQNNLTCQKCGCISGVYTILCNHILCKYCILSSVIFTIFNFHNNLTSKQYQNIPNSIKYYCDCGKEFKFPFRLIIKEIGDIFQIPNNQESPVFSQNYQYFYSFYQNLQAYISFQPYFDGIKGRLDVCKCNEFCIMIRNLRLCLNNHS